MKKLLICLLFSRLLNASYNYTEVQDLSQLKIETPSLSNREVGKIRLANGLDVYLVSDKDTDKSAAAFAVNVGSWSDPKDYPGMAHFVEHLLFLSTKAYPKEDEFLEFIDERGGKWNAYTSTDRTVYMFSVNHNGFKEGLDRFAHFFIDPLMSESGVGRELHAVDQEHDKNIENDLWREWYIFKETGNPNHPNVSFSTGTAKTLGKIPLKDVKGWFQNHYGANHAKLIVYSHLPMDELKALTAKTFKELPVQMNSVSIPYGELTSAKQKGHITYIQPIKDLRSYSINWELPRNIALDSETHATDLIAQVLRYKGENSLYASLKSKGYIESLSVFSEKFSKDHEMFALNFSLTKNGINHLDEISKETFEFLQFIKKDGVPEYIFNETKKIAKIDYAYQSRSNAFTYVREKASELLDEPLETYPRKTLIPSYYSKEQIQKVLQALTPESALYTAMLPLDMVGLKPTKKEKWNHGEYTVKKIPEETLASWSMQTEETSFTIRKENPFIPTNLNLLAKQEDEPSLVVNETFGKMYFFQETEYQVPESHIILNFFSEELDGSCKKQVLTDIYIKEINERLAPINSEARAGGLNAMAYQSDFSIAIRVDGYSEKSLLLLANTLEKMQDFTLSKKKFDLHKSALLSAYENADKELLYQQVVKLSGSILTNTSHLSSLKARAIRHLQYEDFVAFSESLFLKTYIEGLATGNLEQKQVVKIWNMAKNSVQAQPFPKEKHFQKKFLSLPNDSGPYNITEKANLQGYAAYLAIQEGTFSYEKKATQSILGIILKDDFFKALRTKQQTGYIAVSWPSEIEGELLHNFVVQSTTHQPNELIYRFELFLEEYTKDFGSVIPKDRFLEIKETLITNLKTPATNLYEKTNELHALAFIYKGDFDRKEKLTHAIENLEYEDFRATTISFLSRKNTKRLAIELIGNALQGKDFRYRKITSDNIKHLGKFVTYQSAM